MNKSLVLLLALLVQVCLTAHTHQNPAFNNWVNQPGAGANPQNPQNPAFANWANRPGTPPNAQNPAFNNWANQPGAGGNPQNPAFNNWANRPGSPQPGLNPQNPAFNNWANRPGTPGVNPQNPAFNNWANRPGVNPGPMGPGGLSGGRTGFNNWLNRPGQPGQPGFNPNPGMTTSYPAALPGLGGALNNWMGSSGGNFNNLDIRLRQFLAQNRINVPVPDASSCLRYSVPNSASRYQVSCVLPNGQRFTEVCTGPQQCNLVTCKLAVCSRIPGGRLLRTPF